MMNSIPMMELIKLGILLGSMTFVVGLILFFYFLKRIEIKGLKLVIYCILQVFISVTFSIIIWRFWIFKIDIMLGGIFLPGIFAELITILLLLFFIKRETYH